MSKVKVEFIMFGLPKDGTQMDANTLKSFMEKQMSHIDSSKIINIAPYPCPVNMYTEGINHPITGLFCVFYKE